MPAAGLTFNLATLLLTWWLVIERGQSRRLTSQLLAGCSASNEREKICVLTMEADKYLEWSWFEAGGDLLAQNSSDTTNVDSKSVLDGTLRFGIGKSVYALNMDALGANLEMIHKARVFTPFYSITSDEQCEFGFSYRVNERNSYVSSSMRTAPTQNGSQYHWPKVSIVLMRPANEERHNTSKAPRPASLAQVRLLNYFEHPGSYLASEFDSSMLIGAQMAGSWSLAILIETRLDADLLEFTRMKLTNCEPTGKEMDIYRSDNNIRRIIDLDEAFSTTCNDKAGELFQCSLSGRCLSLDYRCDFGRDCGSLDDSDEFRCSADFEGRCDFEEDMCEWTALPRGEGNSWTWTSVADKTTLDHKPPLDHTLQKTGKGHYLLLGLHQLEDKQSRQLIGPRVQLKAGHSECKFRFWVYVPESLRSTKLRSSTLFVGHQQIGPNDLFGETGGKAHLEENNWRRFQVTLFTRDSGRHNDSLFALHVIFSKFSEDLELLSLADAYLALDDFSFSPGCALTFYNKPPSNLCGDTEFECNFAPPKTPKQFCLPSNRVCDFKNDCGHHEELSASGWSLSAASDEAYCMSWFSVERSSSFVGLELSGIQVVNHVGESQDSSNRSIGLEVNEAFELGLPEFDKAGGHKLSPFKFQAQYDKFIRNLQDHGEKMRHVTEASLQLPRFHQAHANCRLHLTYAWDRNSRNLLAGLYLIRAGVSTLYRRWSCDKDLGDSKAAKFSLSLGLGEQNSPFSVQLRVSVESFEEANRGDDHEFSGWFSLLAYEFEGCAHQAAQVSLDQAQTIPIGDVDEEDEEAEHQDEYRHEFTGAATELDLQCPETMFQCGKPILCLDERLVCDQQRDCQESGVDEMGCASRGYIQYDFEDLDRLEGWWPPLSMSRDETGASSPVWSRMSSVEFGMRQGSSLPPVDHSLGRASGHFLGLRDTAGDVYGGSQIVSVATPAFEVLETCKRLVLYIYETSESGQAAYSFKITYFDESDQSKTDELTLQPDAILPVGGRAEGWNRLEFGLPHSGHCRSCRGASRFTIGISSGRDSARPSEPELAIDDMTLGPKCQLSDRPNDHRQHKHEEAKTIASDSSIWLWCQLMCLTLLALFVCSIGLLVYSRRLRRSAQSEQSGENYVPLDRLD